MLARMSVQAAVRSGMAIEQRTDRIVNVFTAAVFVVVAAVGFAPRSAAILSGACPVRRWWCTCTRR
jgi:hypothetical protein